MSKKTEVLITANAKQAQMVIQTLEKRMESVRKAMERLKNAGKQNTDQYKQLSSEFKSLDSLLKQNETDMQKVNKVVGNLANSNLRQLKSALSAAKREMQTMSATSKELPQLRKNIAAIEAQIRKVTGTATGFNKVLKNMTGYFSAFMVLNQIKTKLQEVIRLNLQYSDQLADIRKVSGLASEDVDRLSRNLQKIDTRSSQEQLLNLAYAGSRLGIGKYGVQGLEEFTCAADQLNVALHEDLGDEAITQLSKMTEVMGLIPKLGVERALLATGSSIFKLASTSTSNGEHIVQFAERLTGLSKVSGITTDQLLALGSASDSMMLMPEVAATAFSKLISAMQVNHNLIEKSLHIEPGTINNLYASGQAMDAIVLILEKMHEKGNMNALDGIFKDLGSDGARLKNVLVTMSANLDMLKGHLDTSSRAFREATAVTQEYEIQQGTANAILERANNLWVKAFVNPEGRDSVKTMTQAWYDLSETLTKSNYYVNSVQVTLWILANVLSVILKLMPTVITYFMFKGIVSAVSNVVGAFVKLAASLKAAKTAQEGLNLAQNKNVFLMLASLAIQVGVAIYSMSKKTEEAAEKVDELGDAITRAQAKFDREIRALDDLVRAIGAANGNTAVRANLIKQFNDKYGSYLNNLLTEKSTAEDIADAYRKVNDELRKKIYLEVKNETMDKVLKPGTERQVQLGTQYEKYVSSAGMDSNTYGAEGLLRATKMYWERKEKDTGYDESVEQYAHRLAKTIVESSFGAPDNKTRRWLNDHTYVPYNYGSDVVDISSIEKTVSAYIKQYKSNNDEQERVNRTFAPYIEEALVNPGTLDNNAEDKEEKKRRAAEERKRKKEEREAELARQKDLRLQLSDANNEARTLITDIKNFYEQQIADIYEQANATGMSENMTKGLVAGMRTRMAQALTSAREALVGLEDQEATTFQQKWADFLQSMGTDVLDKSNEQNDLLLMQIQQFDPSKYKEAITNISKMLKKPEGVVISRTWEQSTRQTMNEARSQNDQAHLRKEEALKNSYVAKTNADYENKFDLMGYAAPTPEQTATMLGGGEEGAQLVQQRHDAIQRVLDETRNHITDLYTMSADQQKSGASILSAIFGIDESNAREWAMDLGLDTIVDMNEETAQGFYNTLLAYFDDYVTAQRKELLEQKKNLEFLWSHSPDNMDNQNSDKYDRAQHLGSEHQAYQMTESIGIDLRPSADPEIELYRMKMEAAQAYYDFLMAHQADEELLTAQSEKMAEARANYEQRMLEQTKQKMDTLRGFTDALEEAGSTLGEALADEEMSVKDATKEIIKSFMKVTMHMIQEQTKQAIQTKLFNKKKSKLVTSGEKDVLKIKDNFAEQGLNVTKTAGEAEQTLTETMEQGTKQIEQTVDTERLTQQVTNTQQEIQTESGATQAKTAMGIAGGASKIIGSLGWWGIPLVAVITALLNGLLSFAMSKVSKLFGGGGGSDTQAEGANIKLAQGMLTYDSGNVQAFEGVESGKTYPVVGNDGRVYAATKADDLVTGLVRDPITTLVNGQPALVAEKGPEMVIGRETTAAMMMARPDLLREIVEFDRRRSGQTYRAYDAGNIPEIVSIPEDPETGINAEIRETLNDMRSSINQLNAHLARGIRANINMYGRDGLHESMQRANQFMKGMR